MRGCGMGICSYIREEIQVIRDRDPALKSDLKALLYPSFRAILLHRIAHRLFSSALAIPVWRQKNGN